MLDDWDSRTKARDAALALWMQHSGPLDWGLTQEFLLDGSHRESMPIPLVRAQERLLEMLKEGL